MSKWAPILALAIGLFVSFLFNNDKMGAEQVIMAGIIYGLSASGIYSGTKATAHAVKGEQTNANDRL